MIELKGEGSILTDTGFKKREVMYPLLKIRAPMKLLGDHDTNFKIY
jgi:hypothetical protein